MGRVTTIGWTRRAGGAPGATWNPWQGCIKVSAGCKHCYMYREKERYGQDPSIVLRSLPATFNAPLKWKPGDLEFIFTCSWSDWFIKDADAWRDEAWDIIRRTPHFTYLILTKRADRIADHLPWGPTDEPWPNVWVLISAEDQATLDERTPHLLRANVAKRGLSLEPLLGPIHIDPKWLYRPPCYCCPGGQHRAIDWIIYGGESGGRDARPTHPSWFRSLRDQAVCAGIPQYFKQHGEWLSVELQAIERTDPDLPLLDRGDGTGLRFVPPLGLEHIRTMHRWEGDRLVAPEPGVAVKDFLTPGTYAVRCGVKAAGNLLDGHTWEQHPERTPA